MWEGGCRGWWPAPRMSWICRRGWARGTARSLPSETEKRPHIHPAIILLQMKSRWESNIKCLLWNLIHSQTKNENWLQGLIVSIYDPLFSKLSLGSTAGAEGRAGNCREPLSGSSSLPFSLLLRFSWEFSHAKQENRDSKKDRSWEYINGSQIHECRNWERGHAVFISGNICFEF